MDVVEPPNFVGTVLVSIPNDPDLFQGNRTIFRKMFIFAHSVHYMTQGTFFGHFEVKKASSHIPLHPTTGLKPQQGQ